VRFEFMRARRHQEIAAIIGAFAVQAVGHEDIGGLGTHVHPGHARIMRRQRAGAAAKGKGEQEGERQAHGDGSEVHGIVARACANYHSFSTLSGWTPSKP